MTLIKNAFPILEYDTDNRSVLMPDHENLNLTLPPKCLFAFLHGKAERYAREKGLKPVGTFLSSTKHFPVFVDTYKGEDICLCDAPVGSAPAAQFLDWLISYGVKTIIATGSCGVLCDLPENTFLVPSRALRDEGASYHYLPPARFISINKKATAAILETLENENLPAKEVTTWTTDGFFRETPDMVLYRKAEGCEVVEMEVSALAAVSAFRGAVFGHLLFSGDTLHQLVHDERGFGQASHTKALELCFEILLNM